MRRRAPKPGSGEILSSGRQQKITGRALLPFGVKLSRRVLNKLTYLLAPVRRRVSAHCISSKQGNHITHRTRCALSCLTPCFSFFDARASFFEIAEPFHWLRFACLELCPAPQEIEIFRVLGREYLFALGHVGPQQFICGGLLISGVMQHLPEP